MLYNYKSAARKIIVVSMVTLFSITSAITILPASAMAEVDSSSQAAMTEQEGFRWEEVPVKVAQSEEFPSKEIPVKAALGEEFPWEVVLVELASSAASAAAWEVIVNTAVESTTIITTSGGTEGAITAAGVLAPIALPVAIGGATVGGCWLVWKVLSSESDSESTQVSN